MIYHFSYVSCIVGDDLDSKTNGEYFWFNDKIYCRVCKYSQ